MTRTRKPQAFRPGRRLTMRLVQDALLSALNAEHVRLEVFWGRTFSQADVVRAVLRRGLRL